MTVGRSSEVDIDSLEFSEYYCSKNFSKHFWMNTSLILQLNAPENKIEQLKEPTLIMKLLEEDQDKATVTSSKSCEGGSSILVNILSSSVCWSSKSFSRHHFILFRSQVAWFLPSLHCPKLIISSVPKENEYLQLCLYSSI